MDKTEKKVLEKHKLIELNMKKSFLWLNFIIQEIPVSEHMTGIARLRRDAHTALFLGREYLFELSDEWFEKRYRTALRKPVYQKWGILKEMYTAYEQMEAETRIDFLTNEIEQVLLWLEEIEDAKYYRDIYKIGEEYFKFMIAKRNITDATIWLRMPL